MRAAAIAAAAASIAAVAACGEDDGGDAGPAALVPADAPAYVELAVQPEGDAREDAEAALEKVAGSDDPGGDIAALFESATGGGPGEFSEEIEPWLGERLGVYPSTLAGDTETVLVVETTDPDEALSAFRDDESATGREQDYEGHTFELDDDGDAFTLVDDFIVFGRPAGLRQVIDVAEGGDALADSDQFTDAVDELPEDRLASLFAVPRTFIEAIPRREIDPEGQSLILEAMGDGADEPLLGDVTASGEQLTLELSAAGSAIETAESDLLGQVPSDAFLSLALADIGAAVEDSLGQAERAGIPGVDAETLRRLILRESGIDVREVIGALGDGAAFVQGTSEESLGGAVLIETNDADASADLLVNVQELLAAEGLDVEPLASTSGDQGFQVAPPAAPDSGLEGETGTTTPGGLRQPVTVVQRDDRIVAAYGGEALNQVLSTGGTQPLEKTQLFRRARDAAGDLGTDVFVSIAPLLQLAESAGLAEDESYLQAKPYLDALEFLTIAAGSEGERGVVRFVVGLDE